MPGGFTAMGSPGFPLKRGKGFMMSVVTVSFMDHSGEKSTVSFNIEGPAGAAYDWAALVGVIDTVIDTIEDVSLCTRGPETISIQLQSGSTELPADEDAQREAGLRVFYHDTTNNRKHTMTIPGPDKSLMASPGFDQVSWSGTEMAALEAALEANLISRDGNAISIDKGVLIGRRN